MPEHTETGSQGPGMLFINRTVRGVQYTGDSGSMAIGASARSCLTHGLAATGDRRRVTSFHVITPRASPVIHLRTAGFVCVCVPQPPPGFYTTAATAVESDGRGGDDINMEQNDGRCGDDTSKEQNDREWQ